MYFEPGSTSSLFGSPRKGSMHIESRRRTKRVTLIALASLTVCLAATPLVRPRKDQRGLGGRWLITVAFPGQRPIHVAADFSNLGAAGDTQDSWKCVRPGQFAVAFVIPAGDFGGGLTYQVSGTLTLD